MTSESWFLFIVILSLSMASMSVQGWANRTGERRTAYVLALLLMPIAPAMIAWDMTRSMPYAVLGAVIGLGAIELGPHAARFVVWLGRAIAKRLIAGDK